MRAVPSPSCAPARAITRSSTGSMSSSTPSRARARPSASDDQRCREDRRAGRARRHGPGGRVEAALLAELERLMDDLDALARAAEVQVDPDVAPASSCPSRSPSLRPKRDPTPPRPDNPRIAASGWSICATTIRSRPGTRQSAELFRLSGEALRDPGRPARGRRRRAPRNHHHGRDLPRGSARRSDVLAELQLRGGTIPTVFISSRDDFSARLRAVQAGGSAYCPKPVKAVEMAEFLDQLTNRAPPEPFQHPDRGRRPGHGAVPCHGAGRVGHDRPGRDRAGAGARPCSTASTPIWC